MMAQLPTKADGKFCYKHFPKYLQDAQQEFPDFDWEGVLYADRADPNFNFAWYYTYKDKKIILITHYYEKRRKKVEIVKLANGMVMEAKEYIKFSERWNANYTAVPPQVLGTRKTMVDEIWRYELVGDKLLDKPIKTDFAGLPMYYVDCSGKWVTKSDLGQRYWMARPRLYQARDAQRLKDILGQTFAREVELLEQHKWLAHVESIPTQFYDQWTRPQQGGLYLYTDRSSVDPSRPLPIPQPVQRPPIPPEIYGSFVQQDQVVQSIVGSNDIAIGQSINGMSGNTIEQASIQNNMSASPYLTGFYLALGAAYNEMANLMPKYMVTQRTIPQLDNEGNRSYRLINQADPENDGKYLSFNYPTNAMNITIEAGVNYTVEKNRTLKLLTGILPLFPKLQDILNNEGLPYFMGNLDLYHQADIKKLIKDRMKKEDEQKEKMKGMPPPPNPIEMQAKAQQEKNQLEAAKLQQSAQESQMKNETEQRRLDIEEQKIHDEKVKALLQHVNDTEHNKVQAAKVHVEREHKAHASALATHKLLSDVQNRDAKETIEEVDKTGTLEGEE